jgi:hypothetical protein
LVSRTFIYDYSLKEIYIVNVISDIKPGSPFKVNRRFGGTFACCPLHAGFFLGLFSNPENSGDMFLQNVG